MGLNLPKAFVVVGLPAADPTLDVLEAVRRSAGAVAGRGMRSPAARLSGSPTASSCTPVSLARDEANRCPGLIMADSARLVIACRLRCVSNCSAE